MMNKKNGSSAMAEYQNRIDEDILNAVREFPDSSLMKISQETGHRDTTCRRHLLDLRNDGIIIGGRKGAKFSFRIAPGVEE